jgi:hypothetical protein
VKLLVCLKSKPTTALRISEVVALVFDNWPNSRFVRQRVHDLHQFNRFRKSELEAQLNELRTASGWLEEQLASHSDCLAVLEFPAKSAVRRKARETATVRFVRLVHGEVSPQK